jgi:hypothetical protein
MKSRRVGILLAMAGGLVVLAAARPARADLIAAYVSGFGGVSSPHTNTATPPSSSLTPGFGVQAGARLFALELYLNHMSFDTSRAVQRAILGLRFGIQIKKYRLELRAGGGAMAEQGGALTGPVLGTEAHMGVVGRVGVAFERQMMKLLYLGIAVDGEAYALGAPEMLEPGGWATGQDIVASLHLKFEFGI